MRTVGLAGIGALGVSFGSVLAMDAPGAGPGGPFNWGSTLWHEISHAFTLGATDHRVPRWLSEGLAVLDERRARPGWGADPSPSFLVAFHEGRLPTLARFNYGFVRPSYPGQVQHSYFYASLLSEMIEDEYGIGAIRDLLAAYRDGLDTEAAFRRVFDAELDDFGHRLEVFVKARYGSAIDALLEEEGTGAEGGGAFGARLRDASRLRSEGKLEEAVAALQGARDLFPDYAGPDAPSRTLAVLYRERGDRQRAIEALEDFTSRNESDFAARIDLADLREETGDAAGAAAALEEAVWIDPFPQDLHARLARFYEARGDWTPAIRERRALLALGPVDRAAALYHLARALHRAGRMAEARSTVLGALEIAPNYEEALELLLEIRGGP